MDKWKILDKIMGASIIWNKHPEDVRFWYSSWKEETIYLRINNFPEESLYTLISKNRIVDIDDLPEDISIARLWNEALLEAIRSDFARPTVHARNLFHTSIAMYDAWAVYEPNADTYFLGKTVHGYKTSLQKIEIRIVIY